MARRTRERILEASLALFNTRGEPNVTTNHIADELEISPGNLYYHFRNKDDIIEQLFAQYEERIDRALTTPEGRLPGLEDIWLQLHLVYECIWEFRFLYRDLVDILSRNRKLRLHFARILKRATDSATEVMRGLVQAGVMRASKDEIEATASNILLIATFWLNFSSVRGTSDEHDTSWHPPGDDAACALPARCRAPASEHLVPGLRPVLIRGNLHQPTKTPRQSCRGAFVALSLEGQLLHRAAARRDCVRPHAPCVPRAWLLPWSCVPRASHRWWRGS
jgi:AcrR family transcriptional regulator